jgi:hypothetical protein
MTGQTPYTDLISQIALFYALPPDLLEAQVIHESSGDPNAFRYEPKFFETYIKSNSDAKGSAYGPLAACSYGLLQIMLETALEQGYAQRPELLFTPRVGLNEGAKRMQALWKWAGGMLSDYGRALAAYNGGIGAAHAGPPFVNQAYVNAVYQLAGRPQGVTV